VVLFRGTDHEHFSLWQVVPDLLVGKAFFLRKCEGPSFMEGKFMKTFNRVLLDALR
jgi:hypothetical protein